ncbi:MAG: ACT domain-containing protein [Sulfolobales archaeon]|nr:ACT domain-containing protein [Sulfolobales archaeon]
MGSKKLSVSNAVRKIITTHPSLLDCIKLGVVNYSSLARLIVDEVKVVGDFKEVNSNAVKMSLIRFSEMLKSRRTIDEVIRKVLAGTTIELQTDLKLITLRKEVVFSRIRDFMPIITQARFFQLTQGTKTFTMIVSDDVGREVIKFFGREFIEEVINDQSAIILISPKDIITVPGVIAYITSLLSWHGINITQVISCYVDTILVLERKDALRTYSLIEELITQLRALNK